MSSSLLFISLYFLQTLHAHIHSVFRSKRLQIKFRCESKSFTLNSIAVIIESSLLLSSIFHSFLCRSFFSPTNEFVFFAWIFSGCIYLCLQGCFVREALFSFRVADVCVARIRLSHVAFVTSIIFVDRSEIPRSLSSSLILQPIFFFVLSALGSHSSCPFL